MLLQDKENKLIKLFVTIDHFCIALQAWKQKQVQFKSKVTNTPTVSDSELLTILVFYQCSGLSEATHHVQFQMFSILLPGIGSY